jgi:hypothetical protein
VKLHLTKAFTFGDEFTQVSYDGYTTTFKVRCRPALADAFASAISFSLVLPWLVVCITSCLLPRAGSYVVAYCVLPVRVLMAFVVLTRLCLRVLTGLIIVLSS